MRKKEASWSAETCKAPSLLEMRLVFHHTTKVMKKKGADENRLTEK
jgi:hypothetical protein